MKKKFIATMSAFMAVVAGLICASTQNEGVGVQTNGIIWCLEFVFFAVIGFFMTAGVLFMWDFLFPESFEKMKSFFMKQFCRFKAVVE